MNLDESIRIGISGIIMHRIRSVLTALGIIFGVAAVIAMLSIGEGAREEALEQIRLMGVNNVLIKAKELTADNTDKSKANFSTGLTALDGEAISQVCPEVAAVVPQWEKSTTAQRRSDRQEVKVIGTTPNFLSAFGYSLTAGRFFGTPELAAQANVCVIGSDIRRKLFHFEDPIGQSMKIDDQWFEIVGVMSHQLSPGKKVENLDTRNLNVDVYIPLTTAQYKMERFYGSNNPNVQFSGMNVRVSNGKTPMPKMQLDQITVKLASEKGIEEAGDLIKRIMSRRHFGVDDFEVVVPEALVEQSQKTQQIFDVVMGAIASISLLVGGIGIMNIMLASVLERTKEIGVRRAVGATRADVLSQFLVEALFISVVGGLIGIIIGWLLTSAITLYAGWRTVVSYPAILLAFTVSAGVGIGFGYYPAKKAAAMNPIDALRYE